MIEIAVEVRYAETDQMGIVHHAVYPVWFELARTRLCTRTGYHYAEIEAMGYYMVVSRLESRFLRGARYGDTVQVRCHLARYRSRGLRFAYTVSRDAQTLVTGTTDHVWVETASRRPCRVPPALAEPFRGLLVQEVG